MFLRGLLHTIVNVYAQDQLSVETYTSVCAKNVILMRRAVYLLELQTLESVGRHEVGSRPLREAACSLSFGCSQQRDC